MPVHSNCFLLAKVSIANDVFDWRFHSPVVLSRSSRARVEKQFAEFGDDEYGFYSVALYATERSALRRSRPNGRKLGGLVKYKMLMLWLSGFEIVEKIKFEACASNYKI